MAVDLHASDPVFATSKRAGENVESLLEIARKQLGGEWSLVSSRMKLHKTLFEAEYNGRRVIGKVSKSHRAQSAFGSLRNLWTAGMRPPNRYTVTEPLAWLEEHALILQERAPGVSMLDSMQHHRNVLEYAREAAAWLRRVWSLNVEAPIAPFDGEEVSRQAAELSKAVSDPEVETLAKAAVDVLTAEPSEYVPSHGDFHPMNLFVSEDRITAIDLDTFAKREREVDVAYFLAQLANFGLHVHGNLEESRAPREAFLKNCGPLDEGRVAAHVAWTLLRSLHYDTCILKVRSEQLPVMLTAARRSLDRGSMD